jgi:hypothetical protein
MKLVDDQAPYIWRCPKCGRMWGTRAEVLVEGDKPDCDGAPVKIRTDRVPTGPGHSWSA